MRRATALILATAVITALGAASAFAATKSVNWTYGTPGFSVAKNTTVKWTWRSGGHNVVIKKGSRTIKSSGGIRPSGSYSYKFTATGSYTVYCTPHINAGMKKTVTVR